MRSIVRVLEIEQLCKQDMSGFVKIIRTFYLFFSTCEKVDFYTLSYKLICRSYSI
jgi:hypothetical protein